MTTFYLIRHGDKVRDIGDVGLTELGKSQALVTGQFLKDKNIEKIVSSTAKRATQTASIISKVLSISFSEDQRLRERISYWRNT